MSRFQTKKWFVVSVVLGVFLAVEGALFVFDKQQNIFYITWKKHAFQKTLDQGKSFYSNQEPQSLQIDSYLLLREVYEDEEWVENFSYDAQDPFKRVLERDEYIEDLDIQGQYSKLGEVGAFYRVNNPYEKYIQEPWDDVLLKSLYCDQYGYNDNDFRNLQVFQDNSGGYLDTHYLLGLIFLEQNSCYQRDILQTEKSKVVGRIIAAQDMDSNFSDLYAERVVFLYWAGSGDCVRSEWLYMIRDAQQENFGWKDARIGPDANFHTTGLALLAMRYFLSPSEVQYIFQ